MYRDCHSELEHHPLTPFPRGGGGGGGPSSTQAPLLRIAPLLRLDLIKMTVMERFPLRLAQSVAGWRSWGWRWCWRGGVIHPVLESESRRFREAASCKSHWSVRVFDLLEPLPDTVEFVWWAGRLDRANYDFCMQQYWMQADVPYGIGANHIRKNLPWR